MINYSRLVSDLSALGISKGDMILVKASYKSIGKIEGGPTTFLKALLDVLGEEGTLVTVSFVKRLPSRQRWFHQGYIYTKDMDSYTGIINSLILKHPDIKRSNNPLQSYAAIGKYAEELTNNFTLESEPYELLKIMAEKYNAKNLHIGSNVFGVGTTHIALTETFKQNNFYQKRYQEGIYYINDTGNKKWTAGDESTFCQTAHKKFYPSYFELGGVLTNGKVGDADSFVSSMQKTLQIERDIFKKNPKALICDNPACYKCRTSFSFDNTSLMKFIYNQLKSKRYKGYFKAVFKDICLGRTKHY